MNDVVERVARAIANQLGDGFDNAHRDKPHWVQTRGESGGRYRDINEPRQNDYLDAARAAIEEIREPTEAMVIIGGRIAAGLSSGRAIQPYEDDAANIWSAMIDAALADASLDGEK